jgi:hypothetical protein
LFADTSALVGTVKVLFDVVVILLCILNYFVIIDDTKMRLSTSDFQSTILRNKVKLD